MATTKAATLQQTTEKGTGKLDSNSAISTDLRSTQATKGYQIGGEEYQEVLKHWFLLDKDILRAIQKGNLKLLNLAIARINFLKKVIEPSLLEEGFRGEEDGLCEISAFLHIMDGGLRWII